MIKVILFLYLITSSGLACEIKLFERYIKQLSKQSSISIPFQSSNCSDQINVLISTKISELSGIIPTSYLVDAVNLPVLITPDRIEITGIDSLIERQLAKEGFAQQKVLNFHTSYPESAVGFNQLDQVSIECNDCNNSSTKLFHLSIQNGIETIKKFKVHTTTGHKIIVLKAKTALKPDNAPANSASFEKIETFVSSPEDYATEEIDLLYYKINTALKPGTFLQKKHLSKIFLAQTGREVEIYLNHDGFLLQTKGIALQNGAINDFIRVKNTDSKRTLQAKIIGENKVRIDL